MKIYTFDPFLHPKEIVLVGCGGTGSQLARAVARLVYSMKSAGQSTPKVSFIDPDVIEPANVGRQLFIHAEVGLHKAEALARRFNYSLGLAIEWHNEAFNPVRPYGSLFGYDSAGSGR